MKYNKIHELVLDQQTMTSDKKMGVVCCFIVEANLSCKHVTKQTSDC